MSYANKFKWYNSMTPEPVVMSAPPSDLPDMQDSGCYPLPSNEKIAKKLQVSAEPLILGLSEVSIAPQKYEVLACATKPITPVAIEKPVTYGKKLQVNTVQLDVSRSQTTLVKPKFSDEGVQFDTVEEPFMIKAKTPEPIVMLARTPDLPDMQDSGCDPLPSVEKISKKLQFRQEIAIRYAQTSFTSISLKDKAMSPVRDIFKQCPPADPVAVATQIGLLQRNHQTTPEEAMPMVSPFNTNPQQSRYEPLPDDEQELQNILPPKPNVYNSMTQIASLVADEAMEMEMETEAVPLPELPVQRKSPAWKW